MKRIMMNKTKIALVGVLLLLGVLYVSNRDTPPVTGPNFQFSSVDGYAFPEPLKEQIKTTTHAAILMAQSQFPEISEKINFNFIPVNRDLSKVKGVSGRADRSYEIEINISTAYEGGAEKAVADGLKVVLLHELHHVARGWLVQDNKFGPGIDIAAINEGLADVFAEELMGFPQANYTDNPDFDAWTQEILALPKSANYGEWMFMLPDGREAVGYRTGAWLVKKAQKNTGKTIQALSKMTIDEIYHAAGYQRINS